MLQFHHRYTNISIVIYKCVADLEMVTLIFLKDAEVKDVTHKLEQIDKLLNNKINLNFVFQCHLPLVYD